MPSDVEIAIEQAFSDVPAPAEDALTASVRPDDLQDTEPFGGKRWEELDPDFLEHHRDALFWFTPQAFHYYLPAFLKGGLATPDSVFVISILHLLEPTGDDALAGFREKRWSRLSEPQVQTLEKWLAWLLAHASPGPVFARELKDALQTVQTRFWW